MQNALQITFRDMEPSPAVEAAIREQVEKLEAHTRGILGCKVMVEAPHKHHHKGRLFHVRIDLTIPGDEIVIGRNHEDVAEHEDCYVAVRDAFRAAKRVLTKTLERRRDPRLVPPPSPPEA